ncbi:MAG: ribonuclease P protein component [Vulcanimicrobiota bacterium]
MENFNFLKSGWDFENIISRGRQAINKLFIIYCLPNGNKGIRVGICVGKSLGKAVRRNRIKRQIREIVKMYNFERENKDFVIIARKKILNSEFQEISELLGRLISNIQCR